MQNSDTKYILDSTAFYAGLASLDGTLYTTPNIIGEVRHIKRSYALIDLLIEMDKLSVVEPDEEYMDKARELSSKSGDMKNLSEADLSIIALALALDGEVITDDHAIINVLRNAKMKVIGKRIKIGRWIRYCKACKVSYADSNICHRCGNRLNKRLIT